MYGLPHCQNRTRKTPTTVWVGCKNNPTTRRPPTDEARASTWRTWQIIFHTGMVIMRNGQAWKSIAKFHSNRIDYVNFDCVAAQSRGRFKKSSEAGKTTRKHGQSPPSAVFHPTNRKVHNMDVASRFDAQFLNIHRAFFAQHSCASQICDLFCATLRTCWLGTKRVQGDEPMA